jgi:3-oxoacyl-[acyl-carrier protein] reductase
MMYNQTIVISGASRGIGKAIVDFLAKNPSNQIIALSRDIDAMNRHYQHYQNVTPYYLNLDKNVREQVQSIIGSLEKIDFLINNAGKLVNKPFPELTHEEISMCYQVNAIGVMETVQAMIPKMIKSGGHIVNISSMGGFQGSMKFAGLSAYSTSKAAVCSFTELFAEEYKETSIKMNCLCLGAVQTEMLQEAFPGYIAPVSAEKMAEYIANFTLTAHEWMNGKIIPVSLSNP